MSKQSSVFDFSQLGAFSFNFKSSPYNVPNAQTMLSKPPILRALKIVNKLLGSDEALLELYGSLARMFQPNLSDEQVLACIHDSERFGLSVVVETSKMNEGAIISCVPNKGIDAKDTNDHRISFTDSFTNYPKGTEDRVCYLHILKILQEVSHTMTPSFAKTTNAYANSTSSEKENLDIPEKLGAIWLHKRKGKKGIIFRYDAGSAWEMDRVGGRILGSDSNSNPLGKELRMLILENTTQAPKPGNYYEVPLPDAFVAAQLQLFDKWKPGQPIPDMRYHPAVQTNQTKSSSSRVQDLALQSSAFSENAAAPHRSKGKRGQSASVVSSAPTAKYARKSAAHHGGVTKEEEVAETEEDTVGTEEMGEEEYSQLQNVGLALTDAQERLRRQGRKF